jgi:hypothetical protein
MSAFIFNILLALGIENVGVIILSGCCLNFVFLSRIGISDEGVRKENARMPRR